jgi:transposase
MKFILTGGEKSDYQQALPLLSGEAACAVLADKGYDADYIVEEIIAMEAEPVIPSRRTRKELRTYDEFLYKERNVIERMFGKMKHFRSVATRYSKMAVSYLAFVQLAAILLWLK